MNKPQQLMQWVQQGVLSPEQLPEALKVTDALPSTAQQRLFFKGLLLVAGALLLVSGIIFFFAFNWTELHRFSKLAIVQGALLLSLLPLVKGSLERPVAQVSLAAASLILGGCLALVGQTYQTGADTYQLFLVWALLLLPWLLLTQQVFIAGLVVVLANLALWAYMQLFGGLFIFLSDQYTWLALALNTAFLVGLECYHSWRNKRGLNWLIIALLSWVLLLSSLLAIEKIGRHALADYVSLAVWLVLIGGGFYWYRFRNLQLIRLSTIFLSMIAYFTALLIDAFDWLKLDQLSGLMLGLLVMGLCVAASKYLLALQQQGARNE